MCYACHALSDVFMCSRVLCIDLIILRIFTFLFIIVRVLYVLMSYQPLALEWRATHGREFFVPEL